MFYLTIIHTYASISVLHNVRTTLKIIGKVGNRGAKGQKNAIEIQTNEGSSSTIIQQGRKGAHVVGFPNLDLLRFQGEREKIVGQLAPQK